MSSISEAFKQLDVSDDYDKVYRVSYEYLLKVKAFHDVKGFKSCLVALINLDKYDQAHRLVQKHMPAQFADELVVEVAYILYKLDKHSQLTEVVARHRDGCDWVTKRGLDHIVAQSAYRQGQYQEAWQLYAQLASDNQSADHPSDLAVNRVAVVSQMKFAGASAKTDGEAQPSSVVASVASLSSETNYDLLFNQALYQIAVNNLEGAQTLLDRARELCESAGDDDVAPIAVAQAFVRQLAGDAEGARSLYEGAALDDYYRFITKANLASLALEPPFHNVNLVARDLDLKGSQQRLHAKLTHLQRLTVEKNDLQLGWLALTLGHRPHVTQGTDDVTLSVYAVLNRLTITPKELATSPRAAGRKLVRFIKATLENQKEIASLLFVAAVLVLAHLNAREQNFHQAQPMLEQTVEAQLASGVLVPAIVGVLLHIYSITGSSALFAATWKTVDAVLAAYVQGTQVSVPLVKSLALKALTELPDSEVVARAREALQKLQLANPDDAVVLAALLGLVDGLKLVEELCEGCPDVSELLAIPIDDILPQTVSQKLKQARLTAPKKKLLKKKKRAAKFGPNKVLVPEKELKLDAERWLPMKLRSYYKPLKKEKKKMGGSHQGALETSKKSKKKK